MNDLIYGRRPVLEALESKTGVDKILIAGTARGAPILDRIRDLAQSLSIPVSTEDRRVMDSMSGGRQHQGVIAISSQEFAYADFNRLLDAAEVRLLLLDGITDSANLGSMLRSAEAFGFTGVLIPRHGAAGVTPAVRKVASGAAERVPVVRVGSAASTIQRLQKAGVLVVGLDSDGSLDYRKASYSLRVCLVLGAEGTGIGRLVRDRCDLIVRIPMVGAMRSLNVAVAAAVVMVEVTRSRELDDG